MTDSSDHSTPVDGHADVHLARIFERHSAAVLAYALRRTLPEDAADVVSETFVVAWRRIDDVPSEPAVRPWLYGVARRVMANQRRGRRRRGALVARVAAHLGPAIETITPAELTEADAVVHEAMAQLPAVDRDVLALTVWEQLSPAEIAVVLGISGSAARKRLFRARQRMAVLLDQSPVGGSDDVHEAVTR